MSTSDDHSLLDAFIKHKFFKHNFSPTQIYDNRLIKKKIRLKLKRTDK